MTDEQGHRIARPTSSELRTSVCSACETVDVLLLGDSFMEALQVEHADSFAGLTESGLSDHIGRPVDVANAAVGGWDPPQYRIQAGRSLSHGDYDLVVVAVYTGNDIISRRVDYHPPWPPTERPELRLGALIRPDQFVDHVARPVNNFLETRSHLFTLLKNNLSGLRIRLGLSPVYLPDALRKSEETAERWDVTTDVLQEIHQLAGHHETPVLFLLIPSRYQVDESILSAHLEAFDVDADSVDPDQPSARLAYELRERDLRFVDPLQEFRRDHEEGHRLYGSVDPHFTPRGHLALWRASVDSLVSVMSRSTNLPTFGSPSPTQEDH